MVWWTGSCGQAIWWSIPPVLNVRVSSRWIFGFSSIIQNVKKSTPVCVFAALRHLAYAGANWMLLFFVFFLTFLNLFFWFVLQMKTHGPSYTRLHAPWPVLCREAEFLKIKVPTKTVRTDVSYGLRLEQNANCLARFLHFWPVLFYQSYKIKEESGFGSRMSTVWRKLNQPFQPKVPHQDQESTKFLSHCFSRDKLHLWDSHTFSSFRWKETKCVLFEQTIANAQ